LNQELEADAPWFALQELSRIPDLRQELVDSPRALGRPRIIVEVVSAGQIAAPSFARQTTMLLPQAKRRQTMMAA